MFFEKQLTKRPTEEIRKGMISDYYTAVIYSLIANAGMMIYWFYAMSIVNTPAQKIIIGMVTIASMTLFTLTSLLFYVGYESKKLTLEIRGWK